MGEAKVEVPKYVLGVVCGSEPADWKQHSNGGGWVYKTARVDESSYLHPTSIVYGDALVSENARVSGDALVYGNARVYGNAWVSGNARVYGNALVSGDARVYGDALVSGNARVSGNAWVYGDAWVSGNALVSGNAWEFSPLYIQGSLHSVTLCSLTQIAIGCHVHDFAFWKKNYKAIGKKSGYTPEQVAEYGEYIALCIKRAKWFAKHLPHDLAHINPALAEGKEEVEGR